MIDLHTHTFLSDGALLASELARRADYLGIEGLAFTDHVDGGNIESVIKQLKGSALDINSSKGGSIKVIYGVELTHVPVNKISKVVKRGRTLGAQIIIGHGETPVEPVEEGTNMAYIKAKVDVLAHPGLITAEECALAAKNNVALELTSRGGHSLTNGHVAKMAKRFSVPMVINSDSHAPRDLITDDFALKVALGSGLTKADFKRIAQTSEKILKKGLKRR